MAKPQTERGFVMIACDLFAALTIADWPKREWTVLAEIMLQQYGPKKLKEVHLNPRDIEHYSGLSSKNVYRAIRNLKACNVIRETGSGGVTFVKDYEEWLAEEVEKVTGNSKFVPRLRSLELRFPASANARHGIPETPRKPHGKPPKNGVPTDTDIVGESSCVGVPTDTPSVPLDTELPKSGVPLDTASVPLDTANPGACVSNGTPTNTDSKHLGDAASGETQRDYEAPLACERAHAPEDLKIKDKERKQEKAGDRVRSPSLFDSLKDQPPRSPTRFSPNLGTATALISGPGRDSQEAVELEKWAEHLGTDPRGESYCRWARSTCDYAPAPWVRALLQNRVAGRSDLPTLPYIGKILGAWMDEGECQYFKSKPERKWHKGESSPSAQDPTYAETTSEDLEFVALLHEAEKKKAQEKARRPR